MAGQVGVPGVGVDDVGALEVAEDREVCGQGLHGPVGGVEPGRVRVRQDAGPVVVRVTRLAEGVHADVGAGGEDAGQLGDVDAGTAVDGRGNSLLTMSMRTPPT